MAIRNTNLGGTDWLAGDDLLAADINDTFNAVGTKVLANVTGANTATFTPTDANSNILIIGKATCRASGSSTGDGERIASFTLDVDSTTVDTAKGSNYETAGTWAEQFTGTCWHLAKYSATNHTVDLTSSSTLSNQVIIVLELSTS